MSITGEMCKKLISKALLEEFGYKNALLLYSLCVMDVYETNCIFNIKVLREIHLNIKKAIEIFYRNSDFAEIKIVAISGSIRGLRKKVVGLCKKQVQSNK